MDFSRRNFFKMLTAGAVLTAGELWIPGEKTIFLPPTKIYTDNVLYLNALGRVIATTGNIVGMPGVGGIFRFDANFPVKLGDITHAKHDGLIWPSRFDATNIADQGI